MSKSRQERFGRKASVRTLDPNWRYRALHRPAPVGRWSGVGGSALHAPGEDLKACGSNRASPGLALPRPARNPLPLGSNRAAPASVRTLDPDWRYRAQ